MNDNIGRKKSGMRMLGAGVLALVLIGLAVPTTAWHGSTVPVIGTWETDGGGAVGVRVDVASAGEVVIELVGEGPATSSTVSLASFFYNADKQLTFGFAFTGHSSPDRLIVTPFPAGAPEPVPVAITGDEAAVGDVDYAFTTSETDAACPFACLAASLNVEAGTYYVKSWIGGVSATTIEVRATDATADVNIGTGYGLGDPEITGGDVNVQGQQTVDQLRLGGKAMLDATLDIAADGGLDGFWGVVDFKLACSFLAGACVWGSTVTSLCYGVTGDSCSPTKISYDGPTTDGAGSRIYVVGDGPGDYTFRVDSKVDAYGPFYYEPTTGTFISLGEEFSYLTAGDVALP